MTAGSSLGPPVRDEELMRFLDEELDEERCAEVAARLEQDAEARDKLAGLDLAGELLREQAATDERADTIADAVMAKLEAGEGQEAEESSGHEGDDTAGADVVKLPVAPQRVDVPASGAQPANDNRWSIFGMAAAAAAVAAGLWVWSRSGADEMDLAGRQPTSAAQVAAADTDEATAAPRWPAPAAADTAEPDEEATAGVEVAAVDFGSHTGSVFYVSTGPEHAATTTAVVWVTDDVTGDGQ